MENITSEKIEKMNSPTSFSDGVRVACRQDGMVLLQFFSKLPSESIESHRTIVPRDAAKSLAESILKALDDLDNILEKNSAQKK